MRTLRLREVKCLTQGHTAWSLNSGSSSLMEETDMPLSRGRGLRESELRKRKVILGEL